MEFRESGWLINNGEVTFPSGLDPIVAWHFVQEAIYDGHLPVVRAIGYRLNTDSSANIHKNGSMLDRFQSCAEDRMSLVANFSNLLFIVDPAVKMVRAREFTGVLQASNAVFTASAKPIKVLSTRDVLMTALEEASLDLSVALGTGYQSADINYDKIRQANPRRAKTSIFPMYSYHNIMDFVRVFPYVGDGKIRLHYKYGMTDDVLTSMFERLFELKLDKEWCSQYKEVLC